MNQGNEAISSHSSSRGSGSYAALYAHRCPEYAPKRSDVPTVFVIDEDSSVRETMDTLIRSAGWQPRAAASAEEFLAGPKLRTPSCLLAELRPPVLASLDLRGPILTRRELPVILMSGQLDAQAAIQAIKAGAFELLIKPLVAEVLLATIRDALERSREALDYLAHIETLQARYASLSVREKEVTDLVVAGRLNKQVAGDLGITEFTVKVHRGRAMRKMLASSFAELVTMTQILHRETHGLATRPPARLYPLMTTSTFVHSTHAGAFGLMPA